MRGVEIGARFIILCLLALGAGSRAAAQSPAFVSTAEGDSVREEAVSREAVRAVRLRAQASADSVTAGERFVIRYTATYPDSFVLLPPGELDTGNCRFVSIRWKESSEGGLKVKQADLTVLPVAVDRARLPGFPFHFLTPSGDTLLAESDEVEVPIRALAQGGEPRSQKPQWEAPPSYAWVWYALGALALAALAVYLLRRRKKAPAAAAPEPELPPDYVALRDLEAIERLNLVEKGELKRHYTLVVDVVRHYLKKRYGIPVMDRTTEEILLDLDRNRLRPDGIEALLREADFVKFAKYRPEAARAGRVIGAARDIIVRSAPRDAAAGE